MQSHGCRQALRAYAVFGFSCGVLVLLVMLHCLVLHKLATAAVWLVQRKEMKMANHMHVQ